MNQLQTEHSISINILDNDGRTALHIACSEGHVDCVAFLLAHPDIKLNICDKYHYTAIEYAIKKKRTQIISMIRDKALLVGKDVEIDYTLPRSTRTSLDSPEEIRTTIERITREGMIMRDLLVKYLTKQGFDVNRNYVVNKCIQSVFQDKPSIKMDEFKKFMETIPNVIQLSLQSKLVVQDWNLFTTKLKIIFEQVSLMKNKDGKVADYIQKYHDLDEDSFGISVCTVDGQTFSLGTTPSISYTIQSCMKPILYSIVLEEYGTPIVNESIGKEPSGMFYNTISLNTKNKPHNPLINSGGLVLCSIYHPEEKDSQRFKNVLNRTAEFAGCKKVGFRNDIYLSEREYGDINRSLSYFLASKNCFPENTNIEQNLDFYLQFCCIEVTNEQLASIGATFANYGVNPLSGSKLITPQTAIRTMQVMYTCGLDGEWSCDVGLPAKSGISGGLFISVPGICGISIFSPFVDANGTCTKGKEFARLFVETFPSWNLFGLLQNQ